MSKIEDPKKPNRVEQHIIKKNNQYFKIIDDLCWRSKNVYNLGNFYVRQCFTGMSSLSKEVELNEQQKETIDLLNNKINNINTKRQKKEVKQLDLIDTENKVLFYDRLYKLLQDQECYKLLGSASSQQTLKLLDKNWKSFFASVAKYKTNPEEFTGRPKLPKYKNTERGRYNLILQNQQCNIKDGTLNISWKPLKDFSVKTNVTEKLMQVRFKPFKSHILLEIVYEVDVPKVVEYNKRIIGIDMGVNNFATVSNNVGIQPFIINGKPLKSINQFYNKEIARLKSDLKTKHDKDWSHALQRLTDKRNNKIKDYIHKSSRHIINFCVENNIDTIVIGKNDGWKQEVDIGKRNNQNFVSIPFNMLISQLDYKCEDIGINFFETEEKYTSGTSFLDDELPIKKNYNKSRRKHRGMFKSNTGVFINADLNGSYQIIKKVFPNAYVNGIEGVELHPIVVNIA